MITYGPSDGTAEDSPTKSHIRHCFLITQLGNPLSEVQKIREAIVKTCESKEYTVMDATDKVRSGDLLSKILHMIAQTTLSVVVYDEKIPVLTQANLWYELGVAQAIGKETMVVKSKEATMPSDLAGQEYINFDGNFSENFSKCLDNVDAQADFYETIADNTENNPVLAIDYLKRAYLINGKPALKDKINKVLKAYHLESRAKNSIEMLAANIS